MTFASRHKLAKWLFIAMVAATTAVKVSALFLKKRLPP